MPIINEPLKDKQQTVKRIFELAKKFSSDLDHVFIIKNDMPIPLSGLSLGEYYELVKSIPYKRDIEPIEIVARPSIIFDRYLAGLGKDCKKAAVLMGAYFERKKIPWRIATVSTRKDKMIHHVFPQISMAGEFLNVDATYSYMKIYQPKTVTKAEYFND